MRIRRYIVFHRKTHPAQLGAAEISQFLTWLAVDRRVSASTQNQALAGLLFLCKAVLNVEIGSVPPVVRARTPDRLPVVAKAGRLAGLTKRLSPHAMRHSVARIFWKTGTIFAPCRHCSPIETSGRR